MKVNVVEASTKDTLPVDLFFDDQEADYISIWSRIPVEGFNLLWITILLKKNC